MAIVAKGLSKTKSTQKSESAAAPMGLANRNMISLPRWVVYFQAALLGLIASTFFVFGLMVGSLTSGRQHDAGASFDCRVSGKVFYQNGSELIPDDGAVVFLLPRSGRPLERAAGNSVSPEGFEALDNPGVEIVHQLGGAVVRTDAIGGFEVIIDGSDTGIEYFVLIVSRNQRQDQPQPLTKQQVAAIGTYYMPVERVINDRAIHWSTLTARSKEIDLPTIEF